jgi:hypothetical protein
MKKLLRLALAPALLLSVGGGCAIVTSSMPSYINTTGEAWYTEAIGFAGITWGSRVWYCPAPTAPGPVTCKEAKLIEMTKEEQEAQKEADKQVHSQ